MHLVQLTCDRWIEDILTLSGSEEPVHYGCHIWPKLPESGAILTRLANSMIFISAGYGRSGPFHAVIWYPSANRRLAVSKM